MSIVDMNLSTRFSSVEIATIWCCDLRQQKIEMSVRYFDGEICSSYVANIKGFYAHTDSVYIYQCIYNTCVLRGVVETVTIIAVSHFGFVDALYLFSHFNWMTNVTNQISVFISNIVGFFL